MINTIKLILIVLVLGIMAVPQIADAQIKLINPGFEDSSKGSDNTPALGWGIDFFYGTPQLALQLLPIDEPGAGNALSIDLNQPAGASYGISLHQQIFNLDPDKKLRISLRYKTLSKAPVWFVISAQPVCYPPWIFRAFDTVGDGKWHTQEAVLDVKQYRPDNIYSRGKCYLEIIINGKVDKPSQLLIDDISLSQIAPPADLVSINPAFLSNVKSSLSEALKLHPKSSSARLILARECGEISNIVSSLVSSGTRIEREKYRLLNDKFKWSSAVIHGIKNGQIDRWNGNLVFVTSAVTNKRILPDTEYISDAVVGGPVSLTATPGEYEPASFVIRPLKSVRNLVLSVGDFKSKNGYIIPKSALNIRTVKCWYQDQDINYREKTPAETHSPYAHSGIKTLMPELLLNDDSLVKIDTIAKGNQLKLRFVDGDRYVDISSLDGVPGDTIAEFPVSDASSLRPVDISSNTNKQFWLTAHLPRDAKPGEYRGTIQFKSPDGFKGSLSVRLTVLPFKLAGGHSISSIYYRTPSPQYYGESIWQQYRNEMENLAAHGVTSPMTQLLFALGSGVQTAVATEKPYKYGPFVSAGFPGADIDLILQDLKYKIKIMNESGLHTRVLYLDGLPVGIPSSDGLEVLYSRAAKVIETARAEGVQEVYFYGIDEAVGDVLKAQTQAWNTIHRAGGKMFVAGSGGKEYFGAVGDVLDLSVRANYPSSSEASQWHRNGRKIVCYANPQSGGEQPDTFRRNFGVLLWQYNYDGAMTYIYHNATIQNNLGINNPGIISWASSWNDFCKNPDTSKQMNMVYPTANGIIDTLQWEGYREGMDDIRYINTLVEYISKAKSSKKAQARKEAGNAQKYLDDLKAKDINKYDIEPQQVREDVIKWISRIQRSVSM